MVCFDLGDEKLKILNIYEYEYIFFFEDFLVVLFFLI